MSDLIFLDTSGLVALLNADDWLHTQAVELFEKIGDQRTRIVTTDLVLAELGNALARTAAREMAAAFIRSFLTEPLATTIWTDSHLLTKGLDRFSQFKDKTWGLVDCVSFEVMSESEIKDAFAADRHFQQAGFRCLIRSK